MRVSREGASFPGRRVHSLERCLLLVAAFSLFFIRSSSAAHVRRQNDVRATTDYPFMTQGQDSVLLGDSTLHYGTPSELNQTSDSFTSLPEQQKTPPVQVERHLIVVEPEYQKIPSLKGHGFFIMGLVMLALCLNAIRSDPSARGLNFLQAVDLNARSLFKFEDVARSLFVVVAAFAAPAFIAVGVRRLFKTLPAYLKWAKDKDEVGIAQLALLVLYSWMFFMDPAGKLTR